jgi:hypothetical protein
MKTIKGGLAPIITLKYSESMEEKYPMSELVNYLKQSIPHWHIETRLVDEYDHLDISAFVFLGLDESIAEHCLREDAEIAICKSVGKLCRSFVSELQKAKS